MKLHRLEPASKSIAVADPEWERTIYSHISCRNCTWLLPDARQAGLDVQLLADELLPADPLCAVGWGVMGVWCIHNDLLADLGDDASALKVGGVFHQGRRVADVSSVVFPMDRLCVRLNCTATHLRHCALCGRILTKSTGQAREVVIRESVPSVGVVSAGDSYLCCSDDALVKLRPGVLQHLSIKIVRTVSLHELAG